MLAGRAALITGSGRGIGEATARKLSAMGAKVFLTDVDAGVVEHAAQQMGAGYLAGDLSRPEFAQELVEAAREHCGSLDIIVNNAGYIWPQAIHKMTDEQFEAILDIHVGAPFRILRAAAPIFRQAAQMDDEAGTPVHRKVVNVASIIALSGAPLSANYAAAKAGVIGLTKTMAKEWGRYRVNVNCIAFGMIKTRFNDPEVAKDPIVDIGDRTVNIGKMGAQAEAMEKLIPLGYAGSVEDAANGIALFCTPDSDYITGEVLAVSGGLT